MFTRLLMFSLFILGMAFEANVASAQVFLTCRRDSNCPPYFYCDTGYRGGVCRRYSESECKPNNYRCESGSECCSGECGLYQEGSFCDSGWPGSSGPGRGEMDRFYQCVNDCIAEGRGDSGWCKLLCQ